MSHPASSNIHLSCKLLLLRRSEQKKLLLQTLYGLQLHWKVQVTYAVSCNRFCQKSLMADEITKLASFPSTQNCYLQTQRRTYGGIRLCCVSCTLFCFCIRLGAFSGGMKEKGVDSKSAVVTIENKIVSPFFDQSKKSTRHRKVRNSSRNATPNCEKQFSSCVTPQQSHACVLTLRKKWQIHLQSTVPQTWVSQSPKSIANWKLEITCIFTSGHISFILNFKLFTSALEYSSVRI